MGEVLIVEDNAMTRAYLERVVTRLGLVPSLSSDIAGARERLKREGIDLILLDRLLGDQDSLRFCLDMKKNPRTRSIPVIILTGLEEFSEEIKSYRFGADLFVRKGLPVSQLEHYIKTFLGRLPYKEEAGGRIVWEGFVVDPKTRIIRIGSREYADLTPKQFEFLAALAAARGKPVSREDLVKRLWDNQVRDKEVDVLVSRLRQKLGADGSVIEPVRSHGYRLRAA